MDGVFILFEIVNLCGWKCYYSFETGKYIKIEMIKNLKIAFSLKF